MNSEKLKRAALTACVQRMKAEGLTGKARDDAAKHFLAGVNVALVQEGFEPLSAASYLDVLEQLAATAED